MSWFDIKNKDSDTGEIYIYGLITDEKWFEEDVTPSWFKDEIKKLNGVKNINLFINSGGGGVFAGMAIYNMLQRQNAKITARIDGIAASIASVVAMAADEIIMPKNAMMMIHNPYSIVIGYAADMRKEADLLDKIKEIIISAYTEKANLDDKKIGKMMDEETWMTGEEALNLGFADTLEKNKNVQACIKDNRAIFNGIEIDISKYKDFPKNKLIPVVESMPRRTNANQKIREYKLTNVKTFTKQ